MCLVLEERQVQRFGFESRLIFSSVSDIYAVCALERVAPARLGFLTAGQTVLGNELVV